MVHDHDPVTSDLFSTNFVVFVTKTIIAKSLVQCVFLV